MYKDITAYNKYDKERKPSVLENNVGEIMFRVHKHIYYGEQWLLTCRELEIEQERLHTENMEEAKKLGNARVFNTIIIGVAAKHMDFEKEKWIEVVKKTVPPKTVDVNVKAFLAGYEMG